MVNVHTEEVLMPQHNIHYELNRPKTCLNLLTQRFWVNPGDAF